MVVFLYGDKNCEHQAISCIKSLTYKITFDVKIVYYTVGFDSDFEFKNLHKIKIPFKPEYPMMHFYKPELCLLTMELFPDDYYVYTDTDILFSRRFNFDIVKHNEIYPLASFGPVEYPYLWIANDDEVKVYDEKKLMEYFNVPSRTQRYVWACFYSFNSNCRDFFEEYTSMCKNQYLLSNRIEYFPYTDETALNICLWKRNATKNYGYAYVHTNNLQTVKEVENGASYKKFNRNFIDSGGYDWEFVEDPTNIMFYHNFKEKEYMEETVKYLLNINE